MTLLVWLFPPLWWIAAYQLALDGGFNFTISYGFRYGAKMQGRKPERLSSFRPKAKTAAVKSEI